MGTMTISVLLQDGADAELQDAEEEEEDEENPDVLYEADVMQDQRILDIDDVTVFGSKAVAGKGGKLRVVNPFAFSGTTEDGWQIQNPERLKKKLKRTIILELSRKDTLPDERAKAVNKKVIVQEKRNVRLRHLFVASYYIAAKLVACERRWIFA